MKVLITVPHLYLKGGVANYYKTVTQYYSFKSEFLELGAKNSNESVIDKAFHLFNDWIRFRVLIKKKSKRFDLVHINPSFYCGSLFRDGVILHIAKKMGKKTIVSFHGWDKGYAKIVEKYFFRIFFTTYNKADAFIVLASEFSKQLRDWGFKQPIHKETTPVDDSMIKNFTIKDRINSIGNSKPKKILFLSRIEKEKGIFETIEAFSRLALLHNDLHLIIAGDGNYRNEAYRCAKTTSVGDRIYFVGYVEDELKNDVFLSSDIYVLPSYSEGMPTSVLEAMAFGLPIVTRSVGGIKDFFKNGQHGFITDSKNPEIIACLLNKIIRNEKLWSKMSITCHEYAKERFMASKVAERLEKIYKKTIESDS